MGQKLSHCLFIDCGPGPKPIQEIAALIKLLGSNGSLPAILTLIELVENIFLCFLHVPDGGNLHLNNGERLGRLMMVGTTAPVDESIGSVNGRLRAGAKPESTRI